MDGAGGILGPLAPACSFLAAPRFVMHGGRKTSSLQTGAARGFLLALRTPVLLWGAPKQPAAPAERCQHPPTAQAEDRLPPSTASASLPHPAPPRDFPPLRTPPARANSPEQQRGKGAEPGSCRPAAGRTARNQQSRRDSCGDGAGRLRRNRAGEARQEASALPCGRLLPCCPNPAVQVDYRHWRWLTARGGSYKTRPISPG